MSLLMMGLLASLATAADDEVSPLVPDKEVEAYKSHKVDPDSMKYKPGKGLEIASADGDFKLAMGLRAMFLYQVKNDPNVDQGEDPTTQEVMIRRARITFAGNMWGKDNTYKIELAISPKDESVDDTGYLRQTPLLTWQMTFKQLRDFNLRIGQYKVPYSWERVVSSSKLVLVDRSKANSAFNLDRDIGLDVGSTDLGGVDLFTYNVGVYAGEGRGRFEPGDFGMMYLARFEVHPTGSFNDYEPQDFARTAPRIAIGVGWAMVDNPTGAKNILDEAPENAEYDYQNLTADVIFKAYGFSTEAAFFWRDGADQFSPFAETGMGYYAQPGYLLPRTSFGIAGRFGQVIPEPGSALSPVTEVGPGLSYYLAGARNKMKVQADYIRTWSETMDDGENLARLQLQCML